MNPYLVLGVTPASDDAAIRRAYLEAIKLSPPDLDPRRFQAVSVAYEKLKDEPSRHRHLLFDKDPPGDSPLDTLVQFARLRRVRSPLPFESMKTFLRSCNKT